MKTLISKTTTHLPPTNARNAVVAMATVKKARILFPAATTAFFVRCLVLNLFTPAELSINFTWECRSTYSKCQSHVALCRCVHPVETRAFANWHAVNFRQKKMSIALMIIQIAKIV